MNYKTACKTLDLNSDAYIKIEAIKRQYKLKALMYHPDKNKSSDASSRFQEIHQAYQYLLKHLDFIESDEEDDEFSECDDDYFEFNESSQNVENLTGYRWILYSFLKNITKKENNGSIFFIIIQKISTMCESKALETLEKIDKKLLIKIAEILKSYKEAFHFSSEFFDKIENIAKKKMENDECIILNPKLDDLFDDNIYKLKVDDFSYLVPLWHHELVYDNSGNDVYVKCFPVLPDNVSIDENNNLHVNLSLKIKDLLENEHIYFSLGKANFAFESCQLKVTRNQKIVLDKKGISRINTVDVYDVSRKSDIVLNITIETK